MVLPETGKNEHSTPRKVSEFERAFGWIALSSAAFFFILLAAIFLLGLAAVHYQENAYWTIALSAGHFGALLLAMFVLGWNLFAVFALLIESLEFDGAPGVDRVWGTLGQSAQGWKVSQSLTYVLLCLALLIAFSTVAIKALDVKGFPNSLVGLHTAAAGTQSKPPDALPSAGSVSTDSDAQSRPGASSGVPPPSPTTNGTPKGAN